MLYNGRKEKRNNLIFEAKRFANDISNALKPMCAVDDVSDTV
jgi:hypothetical protein